MLQQGATEEKGENARLVSCAEHLYVLQVAVLRRQKSIGPCAGFFRWCDGNRGLGEDHSRTKGNGTGPASLTAAL